MAPASIDALGGALASFAFGLAGVIGNGVSAFGKRQARQGRLRRAARAELLLALLAARMSAIAYVDFAEPGGARIISRPFGVSMHRCISSSMTT
jgi:hypothetical protein